MKRSPSLEESKPGEAIASLAKAVTMEAPPFGRAYLALAHGRAGNTAAARAQLDTLAQMAGGKEVLPFNRALVNLGIGDTKQALTNLEAALAADSQMMAWIGQDHIFGSLRSEARFIAMLKRMNFAK